MMLPLKLKTKPELLKSARVGKLAGYWLNYSTYNQPSKSYRIGSFATLMLV